MRALLQRVTQASVTVDGQVVSSIGDGVVCLLGISQDDKPEHAEWLARKVGSVRLWADPDSGKDWAASVVSSGREILVVSQFTLYANVKRNKPDFHRAMGSESAQVLYEKFLAGVARAHDSSKVKKGVFGAMMQVNLTNDGPVTVEITTHDAVIQPKATKAAAKVAPTPTCAAPPIGPGAGGVPSDGQADIATAIDKVESALDAAELSSP